MTYRSLKAAAAALAAAGLVAGLAACGGSDTATTDSTTAPAAKVVAPEPGVVKMATEPWLGYGPWYVAQDKGLFTGEGLEKVDISLFNTDADLNAALASGKVDVANIATHTALKFAAKGQDISIILHLDDSITADAMLAGGDVATVADLKGKQVAYEEGTTSDLLLRYALSQNNLTIDDVTKVPTAAKDAGAALIAGRVPAAVTYEPYISESTKKDSKVKVIYTAGEKPGLVSDALVVRNDYLKSHPGQMAALVRAWGKAVDAYNADKTGSQAIINKAIGYDPGSEAYAGVKFYGLADNQADLASGYKTVLEDVKKIATDAGIIEGDVDTSTILDAGYVGVAGASG